jgi:hypothetical protein
LLEQALSERGIHCELASGITDITPHTVTLTDGRTLPATRVVLATGVLPNAALAKASGLLCAKGIVVDRLMQASHPGVSAIGECCEIDGQTWGLVAPCLAQADILAARLAGETCAAFTPCDSGMRLKVTGIELFSAGCVTAQADDALWTSITTPSCRTQRPPPPSSLTPQPAAGDIAPPPALLAPPASILHGVHRAAATSSDLEALIPNVGGCNLSLGTTNATLFCSANATFSLTQCKLYIQVQTPDCTQPLVPLLAHDQDNLYGHLESLHDPTHDSIGRSPCIH